MFSKNPVDDELSPTPLVVDSLKGVPVDHLSDLRRKAEHHLRRA